MFGISLKETIMKLRGWEASQDLKFVIVSSHQMINCLTMISKSCLLLHPHPHQMFTFLYPWFLSPIESTVHIKIKGLLLVSIYVSIKLLSPIVSKDITVTWNSTFVALPAEKIQMVRKFEKCLCLNWEKKENVQRK